MKNLDKFIKQSLEQWEESPSSHCWEAIDKQLSITPPATSTNAVPSSPSSVASSVTSVTSSIAAKIFIATAIVGAIATAVILLVTQQKTDQSIHKIETSIALNDTNKTSNNEQFVIDTALLTEPQLQTQDKISESSHITQKKENIGDKLVEVAQGSYDKIPLPITPPVLPTEEQITRPDVPLVSDENISHTESISSFNGKDESLTYYEELINKEQESDLESNYSVAPIVLEIPNVITPNGDGINDVFVIQGIENCSEIHLSIKDKSGKEIFSTSNYMNDWGTDATAGAYYYYFQYTMFGVKDLRTGVLHVIK